MNPKAFLAGAAVAVCGCGGMSQANPGNGGSSNWTISDAVTQAPIWSGPAAGPTIDNNYASASIPSSPEMALLFHFPETTLGTSYTCQTGGSVTLNTSVGVFTAGGSVAPPGTVCTLTVSTIPTQGPALVPGSMEGVVGFCGKPTGSCPNDSDWTLYHVSGDFTAFRP